MGKGQSKEGLNLPWHLEYRHSMPPNQQMDNFMSNPLFDSLESVKSDILTALLLLEQSIEGIQLKGKDAPPKELEDLKLLQQMHERTSQKLQEQAAQFDRIESIKRELLSIKDKGDLTTPQDKERVAQLISLLATEASVQLKCQKESQVCR